jgi:hypothetical protein
VLLKLALKTFCVLSKHIHDFWAYDFIAYLMSSLIVIKNKHELGLFQTTLRSAPLIERKKQLE